ncbi:MAG: sensor histidine kinase N-terminal domain-containing protein [Gammaproteobacteria bacterium]|nr:sensor histidine kinase N-terminal domain-containing protein [Gammaproteobacteria bacterium]
MNVAAPSIRRRLLGALIGTVLLVWLAVVYLVYQSARHEVQEVFDADLARTARTLQTLLLHEVEEEKETAARVREVVDELGSDGLVRYPRLAGILHTLVAEEEKERLELVGRTEQADSFYDAGLILVARYGDGDVMLRDSNAPDLPPTPPGFTDVEASGRWWRVFQLTDPQSGLGVQVGERHEFRTELVHDITRNTMMPLLVALPILALLVWLIVGSVLAPLRRVALAVSSRAPDAVDAIDEHDAPSEIQGLVQALNRLFNRVGTAIARERQFTADAAHELRTPLAALKTHLQVAGSAGDPGEANASIAQALVGVDRATHTVEQLLLLARADSEQARRTAMGEVDLRELARDSVASSSQFAVERGIDLGIDGAQPVIIHGDRHALAIMLRNLVDNALRYTPSGGVVTVAVGSDDAFAWIGVSDNGPGIAPADRERVFRRFRRGDEVQAAGIAGSGLGLSIVQRIVQLHGARIDLGAGIEGAGLGVTVRFPRG